MSLRRIVDGLGELDLDEVLEEEHRLERALLIVRAIRRELVIETATAAAAPQPVTAAAAAIREVMLRGAAELDRQRRAAPHGDPLVAATSFPLAGEEERERAIEDLAWTAEEVAAAEHRRGDADWHDVDVEVPPPTTSSAFAPSIGDVIRREPRQDERPPAPAPSSPSPAPAAVEGLITPRELEDLPRNAAGGIDLMSGHPSQRAARRDRAILAVYRANAGVWLRNGDVTAITGIGEGSVSRSAREALARGELEHNGNRGAHGRYRAPLDPLAAAPASGEDAEREYSAAGAGELGEGATELEADTTPAASPAQPPTPPPAAAATVAPVVDTAAPVTVIPPPASTNGRPAALVGDLPGDDVTPPPGPRPAISGRLRRQLAAEARETARRELEARTANPDASKPDPDTDATLDGRVLSCVRYQASTISGLAVRLAIRDEDRPALALAVARLVDEGELTIRDRDAPGPRVYEARG